LALNCLASYELDTLGLLELISQNRINQRARVRKRDFEIKSGMRYYLVFSRFAAVAAALKYHILFEYDYCDSFLHFGANIKIVNFVFQQPDVYFYKGVWEMAKWNKMNSIQQQPLIAITMLLLLLLLLNGEYIKMVNFGACVKNRNNNVTEAMV
jgi:hypothetical protein